MELCDKFKPMSFLAKNGLKVAAIVPCVEPDFYCLAA